MNISINLERLRSDLESLAEIGRDPRGGISRPSFSPADLAARAWLKGKIEEAGLRLRQDGAGNIFARLGGEGRAVGVGSHLDTVPNGGKFDGAAGVLAGLECLRRIREEGRRTAKPLELISFTDEEGNLVGDFLGSRAYAGLLNGEEIERDLTALGRPWREVLAGTEFTVESILHAARERTELDAFLELHIEQGAVLETKGVPVGIVERIAGKNYRLCSFLGRADHGGTTPLELRRDAFLAAADFALTGTKLVASRHSGSMITIGNMVLQPGSFSVVPGRADFSLDFRSASVEALRRMEDELLALAGDIAAARGVTFHSRVKDRTEPVSVPGRITATLEEESRKLGYPYLLVTSGAGHDAQILSSLTAAGMIFIPSLGGVSHAPDEAIRWEDLEKGANLLLATLLRLAG